MKEILITGGAGFIGSNLCRRLLDGGNKVICMDNFCSGKMSNIRELLDNPLFTFIHHDVRYSYHIKCDEIYNLACPASPPFYQYDPVFTVETCFLGMKNALECAKENKAKLLQASTSEVYGNPFIHPQTEDYWGNVNPNGVRSCYDEGKRVAETLVMDYRRQYGLNTHIVRIFNTYGEYMREDDGRVVSNFICQALNDEPITIYGDGKQTRSFQYISDLIDGIILLMASECHTPVNIGNPEEYTMLELVQMITELTKSSSEIIYKPLPKDDPVKRRPCIDKAKNELNWQPKIGICEGLRKTIDYFCLRIS